MVPCLFRLIVLNWEQLRIAIQILKTRFLHVANTTCSALGGLGRGGESQTKWIILALGSCLLMILTELQCMRTRFHNSVSLYENYI